jgi:hypothetical protein
MHIFVLLCMKSILCYASMKNFWSLILQYLVYDAIWMDAVLQLSELQLKTCDLLSIHTRSSTDSFLEHKDTLVCNIYQRMWLRKHCWKVRMWEKKTYVNKIDMESRKIQHIVQNEVRSWSDSTDSWSFNFTVIRQSHKLVG